MEMAPTSSRPYDRTRVKNTKRLENVKIIDPLHPETMPKIENPKWIPPRRHPILEPLLPQPTIKDNSNYHENPIKLFDRTIKFHAGIQQACLLAKAKPVQGLPSVITSLSEQFNIENQVKLKFLKINI